MLDKKQAKPKVMAAAVGADAVSVRQSVSKDDDVIDNTNDESTPPAVALRLLLRALPLFAATFIGVYLTTSQNLPAQSWILLASANVILGVVGLIFWFRMVKS